MERWNPWPNSRASDTAASSAEAARRAVQIRAELEAGTSDYSATFIKKEDLPQPHLLKLLCSDMDSKTLHYTELVTMAQW